MPFVKRSAPNFVAPIDGAGTTPSQWINKVAIAFSSFITGFIDDVVPELNIVPANNDTLLIGKNDAAFPQWLRDYFLSTKGNGSNDPSWYFNGGIASIQIFPLVGGYKSIFIVNMPGAGTYDPAACLVHLVYHPDLGPGGLYQVFKLVNTNATAYNYEFWKYNDTVNFFLNMWRTADLLSDRRILINVYKYTSLLGEADADSYISDTIGSLDFMNLTDKAMYSPGRLTFKKNPKRYLLENVTRSTDNLIAPDANGINLFLNKIVLTNMWIGIAGMGVRGILKNFWQAPNGITVPTVENNLYDDDVQFNGVRYIGFSGPGGVYYLSGLLYSGNNVMYLLKYE